MGKHTIDPQISAEHLAGAVRFATVSNADNSLTDYTKFDAFHEYLKETYPLVHKHLTLEHTGQAGLLYHWKGTGKSGAAPLLLMAHQDVVPEGDLEKWTYPPYSGTIADGKIWGRGSSDCKSNLIGQLEAVEALLEKGYEPDYDLYLSYGYMEEVAGGKIPAETLRGTGISKTGRMIESINNEIASASAPSLTKVAESAREVITESTIRDSAPLVSAKKDMWTLNSPTPQKADTPAARARISR